MSPEKNVACLSPIHYLNQCWFIMNWTLGYNKSNAVRNNTFVDDNVVVDDGDDDDDDGNGHNNDGDEDDDSEGDCDDVNYDAGESDDELWCK